MSFGEAAEYGGKQKYVLDLSVILSGALRSADIEKIKYQSKFIIPIIVLRKLREMAEDGMEDGIVGIDALLKLKKDGADIEYVFDNIDSRLTIDEAVLNIAKKTGAILLTSKEINLKIAEMMGITAKIISPKAVEGKLTLRNFFDENTLSVHIKEGIRPMAKKGLPGRWTFVPIREEPVSKEEIRKIVKEIIEEARRPDIRAFIEIERPSSTIIQLENFRIIITKPPFSDSIEITAVRPVKRLKLKDYNLPDRLVKRLKTRAEGILIAGAPGMGKTTFAQALAEFYKDLNKIVKTIEAPRDMILSKEITSYSKNFGTPEEIHDILLLSRPDYTIFDEMRNPEDFQLFADLRLAGVGMVGVVHATTAIDAIQRFIGKIELGMIPSIIDTVIFMFEGQVKNVLALKTTVKVPHGLLSEDLTRPVVVVFDFISNKPMYEIYTFGDRTFVVPISKAAAEALYGAEEKVAEEPAGFKGTLPYVIRMGKKVLTFDFGKKQAGKPVSAYLGSRFIFADVISKSGKVKISKRGKLGRILREALDKGEKVVFYEEEG